MSSQFKTFFLMALLSALVVAMGAMLGGRTGLMFALIMALAMNFGSYWFSDRIVLSLYKAREVGPYDAPMLHKMVEELAARAGIPKPRLYIVPQEAPNAFATGRNPENAAVAVTEGILKLLSPDELKGVLAHELGHVMNRDILLQTVVAVMASVVTSLAYMLQWGAMTGDRENRGAGIAGLLLALLAPLAAVLIQMGISRSREYMADEAGAKLSGSPLALASALNKLGAYSRQVPMQAKESTAHMFIVNPLAGKSLASLFATHPPIEERIARLQQIQQEFNSFKQ
ncbi:MAG: zinc metalloprotease HtpX [Desulfovibrionaceae bacterium]|nr:zinc metalloprotease HtpX [Desulfovibrionaceae bacterium]